MIQRRLWILAAATSLMCQEKPARLTFEVSSIKPSKPSGRGGGIKPLPGGQEYKAESVPVKLMISLMYKIPMRQITGGPGWLDTDLFDVDAKADKSYNLDDLHTMFQNLLADEFKLKFHKEIKEGPVYLLTQDKAGSKMKISESDRFSDIPIQGGPGGVVVGKRVPMQYFSWWFGNGVLQRDERPVIDKTGLDKFYDFTLSFLPELPPGMDFPKENLPPGFLDRPSIFDALRQQLGLKLEAQKGPVEYYVIDHVEKPAEN
ncbi:MAG: TIGR03435 family protein [Bryobacteraceae bacterium]|jgi:uncharacterized protein (TIGR03435 family)